MQKSSSVTRQHLFKVQQMSSGMPIYICMSVMVIEWIIYDAWSHGLVCIQNLNSLLSLYQVITIYNILVSLF